MYYRQTPTWQWLNSAGIVPSNTTAYSLQSIQTALSSSYGALPYLGCKFLLFTPRFAISDQ